MGREGRRRAAEVLALTQFVANVRQVVDDVITGECTSILSMAEQLRALNKSITQLPIKGNFTHESTDGVSVLSQPLVGGMHA